MQRDGQHFLVLEHAGQPLEQLVPSRPHLLVEAADALGFLLASGVLNCDIKPGHLYAKQTDAGEWR